MVQHLDDLARRVSLRPSCEAADVREQDRAILLVERKGERCSDRLGEEGRSKEPLCIFPELIGQALVGQTGLDPGFEESRGKRVQRASSLFCRHSTSIGVKRLSGDVASL